jgi:hypothetical protein
VFNKRGPLGEQTAELPPGRRQSGGQDQNNFKILKVNLSDKKLQTTGIPSPSSSGSQNTNPEGFKQWVTPEETVSHSQSYDYHFYNVQYGDVFDYIDVSLEAVNMMFLLKRYARTDSDKVLLKISDDKNHKMIHNKVLFSENDDFNDRVSFYCYKKTDPETAETSGGNAMRNLDSESETETRVKATLTYEFYPNIVYNINFYPKCTKHIEISNLEPVRVFINGNLLSPGDAPEDFDEAIIEQKHLVQETVNSLELKFRVSSRRKGNVYLKNFHFSSKNMLNDAPKSVHRGPETGAADPDNKGTDPQN